MFDWNEDDGVTDTLWARFEDTQDREDIVVSFAKSNEDDTFIIGDYLNPQRYEQNNTCVRPSEQNTSESKNEVPDCTVDPGSHVHTEEELSRSRYNLDSWSNFSYVDNATSEEGSRHQDHGSTSFNMISNFKDALNSYQTTERHGSGDIFDSHNNSSYKETCGFSYADKVEVDSKYSVTSSEHGHQEGDCFLDCDWGSISDIDYLDGIFRNSGSIFGLEMDGDVDELLSPTESSNTVKPSLPVDAASVSVDGPTENDSSSFRQSEKAQGKRKISKTDKTNGQKILSKSQNKMDEKKTMKSPKVPSYNEHQARKFEKYASFPAAPHSFQTSVFLQPGQVGGPDYVGYFPSTYHGFTGYGYPVFPFPSYPFSQNVHAASKQQQFSPAYNCYQQQAENHNSTQNSDVKIRTSKMTPQEKIEKLRRRQQMHALLAIKQQGKHFGRQVSNHDEPLLQEMLQMNPNQCPILSPMSKTEEQTNISLPMELNMTNERDNSFTISVSSDDHALQETVFHEFQEAVMKLDDSLKLRFKESLYRLARNAIGRRNADNRSSANVNSANEEGDVKNEVTYFHERSNDAMDVEADTNAIDRTVAQLLFPFHPTSSTMISKEQKPVLPVPRNPDPNRSNTSECISEDKEECRRYQSLPNVVE